MLMVSISRTEAAPTPTATARRRMSGASRSRWLGDSVFESRTPGIRREWGFMINAAATTAPQVGATPTSSTPTTRIAPSRQWSRSNRRLGTRTVMAAPRLAPPIARRATGGSAVAFPSRPGPPWTVPRPGRSAPGAALPQRGCLADALAQEVQLGAAHPTVAHDLDLLDARAVDHERPLHADAARDLADGDRAGDAAAAQAHDGALEHLDPLLAALDNAGGHLDRVARGELRQVAADLVGDDLVEHVHGGSRSCCRRRATAPGCRCGVRPGGPTAAKDSTGPGAQPSGGSRSGRRLRVRATEASCRHLRTASWRPLTSTSGTPTPRNSAGRVYCGYSSRPALNDSSTVEASSMAPGSRRATASTTTRAASSPPLST